MRRPNDAVVVGGLSMGGALVLRLAADHPDRVAGVVLVNPAVATERKDVRLLPVLKHVVPSFPGIANDIKKPGAGRARLRPHAAQGGALDVPGVDAAGRGPAEGHRSRCCYFRSTVDHVVDELVRSR